MSIASSGEFGSKDSIHTSRQIARPVYIRDSPKFKRRNMVHHLTTGVPSPVARSLEFVFVSPGAKAAVNLSRIHLG